MGLTLENITKTSSLIGCGVGVGNSFSNLSTCIGGLVLILKGGLGACPKIIIENNTEMHHTQNWWHILNVTQWENVVYLPVYEKQKTQWGWWECLILASKWG